MSKYITIHVEDFVQIRKADIELAPLTLFVGDNNSGKSYLASLIWGILNNNFFVNDNTADYKEMFSFQKLCYWIRESLKSNIDSPNYWKITEEFHQSVVALINKVLNDRKKEFIRHIFGSDIAVGQITFDFPFDKDLSFVTEFGDYLVDDRTDKREQHAVFYIVRKGKCASPTLTLEIRSNTEGMLAPLFCNIYLSAYINKDVSFFPASRTGFLLTYRSLIDESLKQRFNFYEKDDIDYHLTSPQVSFLRRITGLEKRTGKIKPSEKINSIVEFIENEMIHGKISLSDTPLPNILYCPKSGVDIPMYLSSGVVTEIAPLLACLKYSRVGKYWIIEEPEMSLHPELQWRMAQVLIRLVNASRFVLASTHSDIIIQHVNNMIKLAGQTNGKELAEDHNYDNSDIISPDQVRMYQFDVHLQDHSTNVTALNHNRNGFIVPTFGKTLRLLRNEVYDFQHEIDDTETKEG